MVGNVCNGNDGTSQRQWNLLIGLLRFFYFVSGQTVYSYYSDICDSGLKCDGGSLPGKYIFEFVNLPKI